MEKNKIHIDDIVEKVEQEIYSRKKHNSNIRASPRGSSEKDLKKEVVVIKPERGYDKDEDIHPLKSRLMRKGIVAELYQDDVDRAGGYNGNFVIDLQGDYKIVYG